jgi:hypothetical protein
MTYDEMTHDEITYDEMTRVEMTLRRNNPEPKKSSNNFSAMLTNLVA